MHFFLYYLLPFIVVLGILIFFHELGHFLVAKYFGVKVLKFSLGFGYKVVGKKIGETEYVVSSIPLGGYVKMLGENGDEEEIPPSEEARAFSSQHVMKRMAIVFAGPLFNLFLALFVYCCIFLASGINIMTTEVGEVREGSPADRAGIMKGDLIVAVQGQETESWSDVREIIQGSAGKAVTITVDRKGKTISTTVVPEETVEKNIFGEEVKSALIGVVASANFKKVDKGPWAAVQEGFLQTWFVTKLTVLTVVKLFQGAVSIKAIGGPIMIGQMTGQVAQEGLDLLVPFLAVISINLGILNLLPVPILDGGLILFLLIELVLRKPISLKKRDLAQKVGLFFLGILILVVTYNDLSRIGAGGKVIEIFKFIGKMFG
jgi:regulator of sigma E protease